MNNKHPDAEDQTPEGQSRRRFLRKAAYASPVLLTLPAMPSFAQQGSAGSPGDGGDGGDPGGGDPGTGERDCDNPLQPIESDIATNMCHFTSDPVTGAPFADGDDIIVPLTEAGVTDHLNHGDAFGTCDEFFCGAS